MIASHITNKEVNKQKILYPMGYTVIMMSISYNIHDKQTFIIIAYHITHLQDIPSHEVVSLLPVLSEKHICILFSTSFQVICTSIESSYMKLKDFTLLQK